MRTLRHTSYETARFYLLPVAFFVAIIGVSVYAFGYVSHHEETLANSSNQPSLTTPLPGNLLPLEKVKILAAAEAPRIAITRIQLESKDKRLVYVVSLASDAQLMFDARTGTKLSGAAPRTNPSKVALPTTLNPAIDFDGARQIALVKIPDGVVSGIELKSAEDVVMYTVHFADGSSVDITATDGTVVRTENNTAEADDAQTSSSTPTSPDDTNSTPATDGDNSSEAEQPGDQPAPDPGQNQGSNVQ